MPDKNNKGAIHSGHRKKLMNRLRAEGPDRFEDHQLLEALLFFSIPRRDTNEMAHSLIEQSGSLSAVFAADHEALCRVDGIGDSSATLIKLVNGIMRRIAANETNPRERYNLMSRVAKFFANRFVGLSHERAYLMMLDNNYRLLDCIHVCDGTVNALPVLTRTMIEKAVIKRASMVVLAHNHPEGSVMPSDEDIDTTMHLISAFDLVGVHMLEHVIISGNRYFPIIRNLKGGNMSEETRGFISRASLIADEDFYDDRLPDTVTDIPLKRQDGLDTI